MQRCIELPQLRVNTHKKWICVWMCRQKVVRTWKLPAQEIHSTDGRVNVSKFTNKSDTQKPDQPARHRPDRTHRTSKVGFRWSAFHDDDVDLCERRLTHGLTAFGGQQTNKIKRFWFTTQTHRHTFVRSHAVPWMCRVPKTIKTESEWDVRERIRTFQTGLIVGEKSITFA